MTQRQSQVNVVASDEGEFEPKLPKMAKLFSIKKFAEVCRTTPRTVRFYDQKGIIKPKYVDKWTGYRYYDPEQARDFLRIRFMQNFHIPLKQIALTISLDASGSFMDERLETLKNEISEREKELRFLKNLKTLLFEDQPLNKVFKREEVGPFNLFCMKVEHAEADKANEYRLMLYEKAKELNLDISGKDIIFYFNSDYRPKDMSEEYSIILKTGQIEADLSQNSQFYFRTFPKTKALTYLYQGPNNYFIILYQKLYQYIDRYKIKLKGPVFDINQEDPFIAKSKFDYQTLLVFPI
jgi:DNA-binding transcriptional MerR regulator